MISISDSIGIDVLNSLIIYDAINVDILTLSLDFERAQIKAVMELVVQLIQN